MRILTDIGFCVSGADPGVSVARKGKHVLILAAHVDDCMITGSSPELINDFKRKLNDRYALTDLGPVQWLLGIKVTRDREAQNLSEPASNESRFILLYTAIALPFLAEDPPTSDDLPAGRASYPPPGLRIAQGLHLAVHSNYS